MDLLSDDDDSDHSPLNNDELSERCDAILAAFNKDELIHELEWTLYDLTKLLDLNSSFILFSFLEIVRIYFGLHVLYINVFLYA